MNKSSLKALMLTATSLFFSGLCLHLHPFFVHTSSNGSGKTEQWSDKIVQMLRLV